MDKIQWLVNVVITYFWTFFTVSLAAPPFHFFIGFSIIIEDATDEPDEPDTPETAAKSDKKSDNRASASLKISIALFIGSKIVLNFNPFCAVILSSCISSVYFSLSSLNSNSNWNSESFLIQILILISIQIQIQV